MTNEEDLIGVLNLNSNLSEKEKQVLMEELDYMSDFPTKFIEDDKVKIWKNQTMKRLELEREGRENE